MSEIASNTQPVVQKALQYKFVSHKDISIDAIDIHKIILDKSSPNKYGNSS